MKSTIIPQKTRREIVTIVNEFNEGTLEIINSFYKYVAMFKGEYVYLNIKKYEKIFPAGRLLYSGDKENMDFEIYKYSSGRYDKDEEFFPGVQYLNGTVKGALYACNEAYPPM